MPEEPDKTTAATQFEELPDAPPRRRLQLSWSGKLGVGVVVFWAVIVVIGPYISPYHEADILDEALFIVPGATTSIPPPTSSPRAGSPGSAPTTSAGIPFRGPCGGRAPPSGSPSSRPCSPTSWG